MRTPAQAVAWARAQHVSGVARWPGLCLVFVHECYDAPAKYGTATIAWQHTHRRHTGTPPLGVPVYWTGGTHGYGHVALSDGHGYVWSNDVLRHGKIDRVSIGSITRNWGLTYRGWAEDINDIRVWTPPVAPKPVPVVPSPVPRRAVSLHGVQHAASGYPLSDKPSTWRVQMALKSEGFLPRYVAGVWTAAVTHAYSLYQRRLGYSGSGANGVPGMTSLTTLGRKHGFTVTK